MTTINEISDTDEFNTTFISPNSCINYIPSDLTLKII